MLPNCHSKASARTGLALWALFALESACSPFGSSALSTQPQVLAGEAGDLPAVTDVRISITCPSDQPEIAVTFSKPMDRAGVESSIALDEVLGDVDAGLLPTKKRAAIPIETSIRWESNDRTIVFSTKLFPERMYVLTLSETASDRSGKGLDGQVSADIDGDGLADITTDRQQYARIDEDYLRQPAPFSSLPIFVCGNETAASIWRVPMNDSRPRILAFEGLMPNNDVVVRYLPGGYTFAVTDEAYSATKPLSATGILRLEIASPNSSPLRPYAQRLEPGPVLPSTLADNFEIIDDDVRDFRALLYLDESLRVPAPLKGLPGQAGGNSVTSELFAGLPVDALAGMRYIARNKNNYLFSLEITGNSSNTVWLNPIYLHETQAKRPSTDTLLYFPSALLRTNELQGLNVQQMLDNGDGTESPFSALFPAEGNAGKTVRFQSGSLNCSIVVGTCIYNVYLDLATLGLNEAPFEIASRYLYLKTAALRSDKQIFTVHLNYGNKPITDIYGRRFVDGLADGNDQAAAADDEWNGRFPANNFEITTIPPSLQLNDGQWYSPFPGGPTPGTSIEFAPHGTYRYLSMGIMGKYAKVCNSGGEHEVLTSLGMLFATPDGLDGALGPNDLLAPGSIVEDNFGLYRMNGLIPEPYGFSVTGVTVQHDFYNTTAFIKSQAATLVILTPENLGITETHAGGDNICGTADDLLASRLRGWQSGDRILISHRIRITHGDDNSLDGNYDGVLENNPHDDIVLEYQPANTNAIWGRASE